MADRYGERLIWAALLRRWCWSAILLVCIGCHRPPADAPFHRFVEDVVPGQKWHEVKVRIGHETRNVLSAPYRSRLKGIELAQDGTITLGEVAEIEKVRWNTAGIRIQVQRWPAASGEEAGDDTATRVYVPLPAERDVVDLAGTEVQLLAAGEERRNMLVSAREAVALPQEHVTRPVRIPHSARLDFGIGLEGEENDVLLSGARFTLEVERGQERKTVFSQTLERGSEGDVHGWVDATVDLSDLAGSTVRFVFRTESVSGEDEKANGSVVPLFDWSPVWSSPILYSTEARRIDGTPNIILISLDTLRADHLGCYGYHRDTSPNIDKFAEGAFLFENCIAPASWTLPSHASVFTGLHPSVHGAETEPLCPPFAETEKTLTELARERGYLTAAYTEGGWVRGSQGFAQGFELYSDGVLSLVRRGCVEETFTSALQCSENYRNLPFFLFVHTYQVHRPYRPPRRFAEKFDKDYTKTGEARPRYARSKEDRIRCEARYDGEIAYTDEVVGKFLDRLREMDLLDRTAVVIFSDHGEEFWEHGGIEHGVTLYDEMLRVPLIIRLAGENPPSGRVSRQVSLTDLYATVAELLGAAGANPLDCMSLLPLISGSGTGPGYNRKVVVSQVYHRDSVSHPRTTEWHRRSVRTDTEKYIEVEKSRTEELYDLGEDPGEERDIAADNEQGLLEYRGLLDPFLRAVSSGRAPLSESERSVTPLTEDDRRRLKALGYM